MSHFHLLDALRYGWNTIRQQPVLWLVAAFCYSLASGLLALPLEAISEQPIGVLLFATAAYAAICTFMMAGLTHASLKAYDGGGLRWADLFTFTRHTGNFLAVSLLLGGLFVFGFCVFVVPGLMVMALLGFALWIVLDEGKGPWLALQRSWELTRGQRVKVLGLAMILAMPAVAASVVLGQGWLAFGAMTGIQTLLTVVSVNATVYVYRQLRPQGAEG